MTLWLWVALWLLSSWLLERIYSRRPRLALAICVPWGIILAVILIVAWIKPQLEGYVP